MRVGGLQRWSSCDWPGQLAATVFCQGCPWACAYCYNQSLRPAKAEGGIAWADVVAFLRGRRGLLDGVVFSGGEPLAQGALADAMEEVRHLGFRVALHTGGCAPDRLARVLPLVDWVGFDVKAPFEEYERITRVAGSGEGARASLRRLLDAGVAHEARTTVDPAYLDGEALRRMAGELAALGVRNWVLQALRREDGAPAAPLPAADRSAARDAFPAVAFR